MLVRGEAVRQEPIPLAVSGGRGCSLAWLAAGEAPALVAGTAATVLVETRDSAGQRILHVCHSCFPSLVSSNFDLDSAILALVAGTALLETHDFADQHALRVQHRCFPSVFAGVSLSLRCRRHRCRWSALPPLCWWRQKLHVYK